MAVPTEELLRRYQAGQTDLFEAIFDRYKDYVYRVAYSLTRHAADSEEVVQETFLDVLRALPRYDVAGPARFETWLYRVTVNRCKMRFRRKGVPTAGWDEIGEQLAQVPDDRQDHNPERVVQQAEMRCAVWRAVGQLKDIYRQVIVLRYSQDLSYQEIAEALDLNVGTVKSRLNAAHKQLQDLMSGDDGGREARDPGHRRGGSLLVLFWTWVSAFCPVRSSDFSRFLDLWKGVPHGPDFSRKHGPRAPRSRLSERAWAVCR